MDKKDIAYVISALAIILVIAVVIKPLATGQPINTGISLAQPPTSIPATPEVVYANITSLPTTTPPTPVPTWNGKASSVGFVNPATYGITPTQPTLSGTNITYTAPNTSMTTYATISGEYSGTTQVISIPFPYWELRYTIDPATSIMASGSPPPSTQITPTYGEGIAYSGIQGSYSVVNPVFTIQVMDAGDPNRIVRLITPPGGINPALWAGITPTVPTVTPRPKYATIAPTPTLINTDPRPWTEKFFEGQRSYYFIITSQYINSYKIEIRVPTRYIGQY
jgi:hypothetical protein